MSRTLATIARRSGPAGARLGVLLAALPWWGVSCRNADEPAADAAAPQIVTTKSGIEMVLIPAGRFKMGSASGREDESPVREIDIDAFLMDRYEMTQANYAKLVPINGSHFKGPDRPVEMISWGDAAIYCNKRSREEGLDPCYDEDSGACNFAANGYRLPTEAEWEYACRAGTTADYSFGPDNRQLSQYAWFADNAEQANAPGGPEEAERLGPVRHVRQRGRMVQRRVREGLSQGRPDEQPPRSGGRPAARAPGRGVELPGRRLPLGLPRGREPRFPGCLLRPRRDRLPLRATGAAESAEK